MSEIDGAKAEISAIGTSDDGVAHEEMITPAPAVVPTRPTDGGNAPWNRRAFLKAAAMGAAVAGALLADRDERGRFHLGGASALADDLSTFQCTAGDVEIIGTGEILNEPCTCTGLFNAEVAFTVANNAASDRGCITLHLAGGPFPVQDIILNGGAACPGKTTQVMTGFINNYPCNSGLVCFGSAADDGRRRCEAPCSTVSWTVPGQDSCPPDRQISSKCRHQHICIQGRGISLTCVNDPDDANDTCTPVCGGTSTLVLCGSGPEPFTFSLAANPPGNAVIGPPTLNDDETCATYKVTFSGSCLLTGSVAMDDGCTKTATHQMNVTAISVSSASGTPPACFGSSTTLSACASGGGTINFEFFEGTTSLGTAVGDSTGCCTKTVTLGAGLHNLRVVATNAAGCTAQRNFSVTVPPELTVSLGVTGQNNCNGQLVFTATANGGTGAKSYNFKVNGSGGASGSSNTFNYGPTLDGNCKTISCEVTDANGCKATATKKVSQCTTTTVDCS